MKGIRPVFVPSGFLLQDTREPVVSPGQVNRNRALVRVCSSVVINLILEAYLRQGTSYHGRNTDPNLDQFVSGSVRGSLIRIATKI